MAHDLAVKPRRCPGDDRSAEHAALMRVGQEGVIANPAVGSEDPLQHSLVRIEQRNGEGAAVADQRGKGVAFLHCYEQHGGLGAAWLDPLDDAAVADIAKRGGQQKL